MDTNTKTAIIISVIADSDILTDHGWSGVEMYVAIDEDTDDAIGGDVSWRALKDRLTAEGWNVEDEDDMYVHNGTEWVRR